MPFDWTEYLALAVELAERPADEAAARTAMSRAYYAVLGRAIDLLRAEGRTIPPLRTHGFVWRAFKNSSDDRRAVIGSDLDLLRQRREAADYAKTLPGDPSAMARDAIRRARTVLDALNEIDPQNA